MKKQAKKLIVFTDAGQKFGFGHLTRTLSIAKLFENKGFNISYIIDGDKSICTFIENYSYKYEIFNWKEKDIKEFSVLDENSIILIDSLELKKERLVLLEKLFFNIILFDDEKRRNILNKGFVIDWTILSDKKDFFMPRKKDVLYFLGSKYTLLREDFFTASKNKLKEDIESVMISFGGSDVRNLSPKILDFLCKNYPNLKKNIVIGSGFNNINEIKKVADKNTYFHKNLDAKQMISCMQNNDIAISAGGQTLYELAMIGIPTIAILLVENAKDDTLGWSEVGFLEYIGCFDDEKLIANLEKSFLKVFDYKKRKEMIESSYLYLPSLSKHNLVDEILKKTS